MNGEQQSDVKLTVTSVQLTSKWTTDASSLSSSSPLMLKSFLRSFWYVLIQFIAVMWHTAPMLLTSNVTGRHRGPKQKLRAGYKLPSQNRQSVIFFIVECGICAMRVFHIRASSSSLRLPLCQILCLSQPPLLSKPVKKNCVLIHSITQSPSIFDAPGNKAFTSELMQVLRKSSKILS